MATPPQSQEQTPSALNTVFPCFRWGLPRQGQCRAEMSRKGSPEPGLPVAHPWPQLAPSSSRAFTTQKDQKPNLRDQEVMERETQVRFCVGSRQGRQPWKQRVGSRADI